MTCRDSSCEFDSKLQRNLNVRLSRQQVKYALLWSEVELPKLLGTDRGEAK